MVTTKNAKWDKNNSPVGWYIASILVRLEWQDEDVSNPRRRCKAWENTILIRANSLQEAYEKAIAKGKQEEEAGKIWKVDNEDIKGQWHFEGLTNLLPVYDEIEDGSEIMWMEHENKSVHKIQSWVAENKSWEDFYQD